MSCGSCKVVKTKDGETILKCTGALNCANKIQWNIESLKPMGGCPSCAMIAHDGKPIFVCTNGLYCTSKNVLNFKQYKSNFIYLFKQIWIWYVMVGIVWIACIFDSNLNNYGLFYFIFTVLLHLVCSLINETK